MLPVSSHVETYAMRVPFGKENERVGQHRVLPLCFPSRFVVDDDDDDDDDDVDVGVDREAPNRRQLATGFR